MRVSKALLALLIWGCGSGEVDEDFVEEGTAYYFAHLRDAKPAIGITFEEDGTVKLLFDETGEGGVTPTDICLRGTIYTAFGDLYTGCFSHDLRILKNGSFVADVEAKENLWVHVSGQFLEEGEVLDFFVFALGSIMLDRCADASCGEFDD